jgi:hypothetical protein
MQNRDAICTQGNKKCKYSLVGLGGGRAHTWLAVERGHGEVECAAVSRLQGRAQSAHCQGRHAIVRLVRGDALRTDRILFKHALIKTTAFFAIVNCPSLAKTAHRR